MASRRSHNIAVATSSGRRATARSNAKHSASRPSVTAMPVTPITAITASRVCQATARPVLSVAQPTTTIGQRAVYSNRTNSM
ncbi:hypothetical protein [Rhodopseudomonas sp. WA056]|uniref:hypothetical protein n=1 Tax=Rhodopseudomonas sp. WA056 TaxID=2269367 RepID=UPI001FEF00E1|nr:hypothetical protein [Rhodopseudomonas sp. WA056]